MAKTTLQKVTAAEVNELQKIGKQTFFESFSDTNSAADMELYLKEKFSIEQLRTELEKAASQFFFLKENQNVIGYLKVNITKEESGKNTLEIERIYLLSNYQGQGLGKILLEKAFELAKQKNVKSIWLGVWEKNIGAIKFYKRHGFAQFDTHQFVLGTDEQTDILMRLNLE